MTIRLFDVEVDVDVVSTVPVPLLTTEGFQTSVWYDSAVNGDWKQHLVCLTDNSPTQNKHTVDQFLTRETIVTPS
jgi:hypothetical protein